MANIGIDLGTTHSLVAVVLGGEARCLLDQEGRAILPSAVRYGEDGGVEVGWRALDEAALHPDRTFTSTKRLVGRSPAEASAELARFKNPLAADQERVVRFAVGDRELTPVEISAEILKALYRRASAALVGNIDGAVITVPAYFDDAQRQATRDAARLAGVPVLRLLNEPTAAAIAYGLEKSERGRFAIYDLGGGTFDISILELTEGVFQVLATAGDTNLGGDDFDHALASHMLTSRGLEAGALSPGDTRTLLAAAREAKHLLSEREEVTVELSLAGDTHRFHVDLATFEGLIQAHLQRTGDATMQALRDAELQGGADLDGVVLVGGSTRVPAVRRFVRDTFGKEPLCDLDPDEVVALGAAMQADILGGGSALADDLLLLDVLPLSLGLEVMGGVVERILPRVSTIPAMASQTFTTHVEGQTAVDIHVVQGERELARDCRSLARFRLRGIPPLPAGIPRVKVEFMVDADGILHVSAREELTEVEARVDVTPSHGLTDEEIETMLEDAIEHVEEDLDQRFLIEARIKAEQVLRAVEKALEADRDLLAEGEEAAIEKAVTELEGALEGSDRVALERASRRLDEVTAAFAQRRIERDLKVALEGRAADDVAKELEGQGADS